MTKHRWESETQGKNLAWVLPRPKPDKYRGGMPLYAEEWLLDLGRSIIGNEDAEILNLFCGMNQQGFRVDIKPEVSPDICCDAHELTKHLHPYRTFDIILSDPPYSNEEAKDLYGTPKLKYKTWTREALLLLKPKGLLIVYHKYMMPNPDPQMVGVVKRVFIGSRTYHLTRVAIYFQRK